MKTGELLKDVELVRNAEELEINGICVDSRRVEKGNMFIAMHGVSVDGQDFVAEVAEKGASAVVVDREDEQTRKCSEKGCMVIVVKDVSEALGQIASNWNGRPSEKVTLVGVTGTNGKTSIVTLLYQMFRKLGYKVGLLSTVVNYIDTEVVESTHTTPDSLSLNALLKRMVDAGCKYVFMEVSSHSIDQRRIAGLKYNGGIFTNLTRDHLDYHKTVENYLKAKKRFFDDLGKEAFAVTNLDDKNGGVMLQNCNAKKSGYSLRTIADYKGEILEESFDGMLMKIDGMEVMMPFVGRFNAQNVMAVYGAAVELGVDKGEALRILSSLKAVCGRFETIRKDNGVTAIVDYAHTPDALENVIRTINEIKKGKLITVCGCGGNRDKGKRPMMAREAVKGSDVAVFTSDNPRDEEPETIIDDMMAGLTADEQKKVVRIADREAAIKSAMLMAGRDDVVLVAGKGHEDYQIVKGEKRHFSDQDIILSL
ncbi:MAG: UDP-N-acetylmuramoyl-L-alanyl-D-glutamate--2,6-diaminopimelate ligase [Paludibacteraceae bacterium]|nr:UDP-N-acetylmuramoyl-L-alanyl-D-glutamate--2,6-diaminopimelate ligase [Paludibacteraceae bacterium]